MDPASAYRAALGQRKALQDAAYAIGIDEAYIARLVETFYGKVRSDPDLGPVFEAVVQGNWDRHLGRMKVFWEAVALRKGGYDGRPMEVHRRLRNARPEHFDRWLALFEATLRETAPNEAVVETFLKLARQMAARLSEAMFS